MGIPVKDALPVRAYHESDRHRAPELHEILAALSFALDLTEGAVAGHAIRTCLLALRLAEALSLSSRQQEDLYYASLLKDVGCSSNSARMCQIVGGDDRVTKAGAKLVDWTRTHRPNLAMLQLLWKEVLPGAPTWKKTARIFRLAANQRGTARELIELRCDRGASIVRKIGLCDRVADAVRCLDEHWDGSGYPGSLKGWDIPLLSRLMAVGQHLDAFCMSAGPEVAIEVLLRRKCRWFDPEITRAAHALHRSGVLWQYCAPGEPVALAHAAVLERQAGTRTASKETDIDLVCEAFAEVVDAKSPFTFRHSHRVKDAAVAIGREMGLPASTLVLLRRAALLHDVGKLSVPNSILDKAGRLTVEEFSTVKGHAQLSREILGRVTAFREMAVIAGQHHEKMDGSGYPDGVPAERLSLESRLLAVADVYSALSEVRPYRAGLGWDEIAPILEGDIPGKLDPTCFEALRSALSQSETLVPAPDPKPAMPHPAQLHRGGPVPLNAHPGA